MSEMAKSARAANKAKAKRISAGDPHAKVDASDWSPPEALNTEAKTGLRPVSRRAYRRGGKVAGAVAKKNAGKKPRKTGGSVTANGSDNTKDVNEKAFGKTHTGGMKRGGRSKKAGGGPLMGGNNGMGAMGGAAPLPPGAGAVGGGGPMPWSMGQNGIANGAAGQSAPMAAPTPERTMALKRGGRAKKADGGVPSSRLNFDAKHGTPLPGSGATGFKRGGAKKAEGGRAEGVDWTKAAPTPKDKYNRVNEGLPRYSEEAVNKSIASSNRSGRKISKGEASKIHALLKGRASGGRADGTFQGTRPTGGRKARKDGGRTGKGKTNINIIISAGKGEQQPPMAMPPKPPVNPVVPPPSPPMGGPPGAPPPGGMPPGPPPMMRKDGGRANPRTTGYMQMEGGGGGGLGRLQKIKAYGKK